MEITQNLPAVRGGDSRELAMPLSPDMKLAAGRQAAVALKRMIDETNSKIKIGNSEHIKAEAWQTVGSFFNVTTKTEVQPCEIEGIKGAHAKATLIDDLTGNVVGGGEAYCMRDEPNWARKPWMQLASMAQTRSASRALGNKYKWITVMAGYSGTPAEEMDHDDGHRAAPAKYGGAPRPALGATQAAAPAAAAEPTVKWDQAKEITDIQGMLGKMNGGDEELMNTHLKVLTKWTPKGTTDEKFLQLADLPNIGQHKPEWLHGVFKKVKADFDKAFDEKGNPK